MGVNISEAIGKIVAGGVAMGFCVLCIGCSSTSTGTASRQEFDSPAHRPQNPENVRVKVSLSNQMIYVMEKDQPLLVTPTCVGTPDHPTPTGNFKAYTRIREKRSNTYGFHVSGETVRPGTSASTPSGARYVGYPMPYWIEFAPAYGFHGGSVWPVPHTHGCLRLHKNVAPKFWELVRSGTPINIAHSQPEDATLGKNATRPQDYADPDPPPSVQLSSAVFSPPAGPLFVN